MIFNRISAIAIAIAIATSVFLGTTVLPAMAINNVVVDSQSHAKAQQFKFYPRNEEFLDRMIQEVTQLNVSPQKVSVPKVDKSNQQSDSENLSYESFWDRIIEETTGNFQGKAHSSDDILPSWQEGETKTTIIDFVKDVTNRHSSNFVQIKDRIAVFDNDGTLWSEYPEPPQKTFFDKHRGTGETIEAYIETAHEFITTENNTEFGKPYVDLIYQPMVELLDYLRDKHFGIYICSGGEIDFIRSFAEEYYGIPPQNIIGSMVKTTFDENNDPPALVRGGLPVFFNDKAKKPVGIWRFIGKKPIMAVGNSTGDLQMLQYTDDHQGNDLMMLVRHDDAVRELYQEHREDEHVQEALDEAEAQGWSLISVQNDFKTVFAN